MKTNKANLGDIIRAKEFAFGYYGYEVIENGDYIVNVPRGGE